MKKVLLVSYSFCDETGGRSMGGSIPWKEYMRIVMIINCWTWYWQAFLYNLEIDLKILTLALRTNIKLWMRPHWFCLSRSGSGSRWAKITHKKQNVNGFQVLDVLFWAVLRIRDPVPFLMGAHITSVSLIGSFVSGTQRIWLSMGYSYVHSFW